MKNKQKTLLITSFVVAFMLFGCGSDNQSYVESTEEINPEVEYQKLKTNLQTGWNTWDNRSVLTHVYLPDGLALVLGLEDTRRGNYKEQFFTGNRIIGSDRVRTVAHTPDGSFTHLTFEWQNINIRVRTAAEGEKPLHHRIARCMAQWQFACESQHALWR